MAARGGLGGRKFRTTKAIRNAERDITVNRMWRYTFLAVLAETSNVSKACEAANVSPARAYKMRREEPEFRRGWARALTEGFEHLELELLRRFREGDFTTAEGGKYDFANALRILAAHRGTVEGERARQDDEEESAVFASIQRKIDALRRSQQVPPALPPQGDGGHHG